MNIAKSLPCKTWLESCIHAEIDLNSSVALPLPENLPDFYEELEVDIDEDARSIDINEDASSLEEDNFTSIMDIDDAQDVLDFNSLPSCIPNPFSSIRASADVSDHPSRYYKYPFPNAARKLRKAYTPYEVTQMKEDPKVPFYPFATFDEWQLANWLGSSGLPNAQIDNFLKLSWVMLYSIFNEVSLIFNSFSGEVSRAYTIF